MGKKNAGFDGAADSGDHPSPAAADAAELCEDRAEISRVLRRTEEARIYHYHAATKKFPPPRGPDLEKGLQ